MSEETFLTAADLAEYEAAERAVRAAICEEPIIGPAKFARGMVAVSCPSRSLNPTKAYLIAELLAVWWSDREASWIMSPKAAALFKSIMGVINYHASCKTTFNDFGSVSSVPLPQERSEKENA
jgi:hypothetical protein